MGNKRSSHYDWFKGGNNQENKSVKSSAKVIWKFSKIFLFFSLFFFSMWGCVQMFVIKTVPAMGQGVEISNGTDNIAPQVTSIHVDYTDNHYKIYAGKDNDWINRKEDGDLIDRIHQEFDAQVDSQKTGNTLDEANKGGTTVARIVVDGKEDNRDSVVQIGNVPLVWSTETDNAGNSLSKPAAIPVLNSWNIDDKGNIFKDSTVPTLDVNNVAFVGMSDQEDAMRRWAYNTQFAAGILNTKAKDATMTVGDWLKATPKDKADVAAHNDAFKILTQTLGIGLNNGVWAYSGTIPGFASNGYTPISSWGQAWAGDRGCGPFYGIFVYPIAWITNSMVEAMPMMEGWESFITIVIVVIMVKAFTFLISFKSTLQQTKMQELNAKKAVITAKYAAYKGNKQMEMREKQEVSELYKKEGISPTGSIGMMFITMPFLLAIWRVTSSIQHIKGTTWLGLNFAATSWRELFHGEWQYLWIILLAVAVQIYSQLHPRILTKKRDKTRINVHQKAAMKKNNKTQNIMLVVFAIMAAIFTVGLQVYWIISGLWQIAQSSFTHYWLQRQRRNAVRKAQA